MRTIIIKNIKDIVPIESLTLCLGFFDALHLGHLALINKGREYSGNLGVLSFSKSPKELLLNRKEKIINTLEMKEQILEDLDVDYFIVLELSWDILNLTKDDFANSILKKLGVKNIVCGFDYTYGQKGLGRASDLQQLNEFHVDIISEVTNQKHEKISSTLIHDLIDEGNIEEVNSYLSRPYLITGVVNKGFQVGRRLNYRTANITLNDEFHLPKNGVYATRITIDGIEYDSMTNVGVHPTINELEEPLIETFVFDFNKDLYHKEVKLKFYKLTRKETKFSSLDELKNQLINDEKEIKEYLKRMKK